uniref:Uncharacterized protein n=1 Tax=Oryza meridionalis TaxID=40149 RepID=A0A0E0FDM0_9ORYZ
MNIPSEQWRTDSTGKLAARLYRFPTLESWQFVTNKSLHLLLSAAHLQHQMSSVCVQVDVSRN